jgi:hypothetical protein
MIKAAFLSSSPSWNWSRQFPNFLPEGDGVRFFFSDGIETCDVLFVYDAVPEDFLSKLTAKHKVFIASEPSSIKSYLPAFLSQFDRVLTTDRDTKHPGVVFGQLGLPWLVGAWDQNGNLLRKPLGYEDFQHFKPEKTKNISLITSNKSFTRGHRARLEFAERIKRHFGREVDIYGRGINDFADKLEVLAPYRYHIAIENSEFDHYWTEKIADPFLTLTYPIYHGCPNITDYFSSSSMMQINIHDPDDAIQKISRIIDSDERERALPYLLDARKRVLDDHNLFAILARIANELGHEPTQPTPVRAFRVRSERSFRPRLARLRNKGQRILSRFGSVLTRGLNRQR